MSHSLKVCALVSKRATLLPLITAMKMRPSGAIAGSRAKRGVGTGHSRTLPASSGRAPGVMP
ncbi:hypothetical protein D3C83_202100 [compost metagenome]